MRHSLDIGGRAFRLDHHQHHTHGIVARQNTEHFRPAVVDAKHPTPAEREALRAYQRGTTNGRFALKVVEWATSEEEANAKAAAFTAPEWLDVRVLPVTQVIPHA